MAMHKLNKYDIILASASPRRQELLQQLGVDFKIHIRTVDEQYPEGLDVDEIASFLSNHKADAFEADYFADNTLLIAADTIVCLEGKVLGKPAGQKEAIDYLQQLSGKMHRVITGVSMRGKDKRISFSVNTDVYFKNLSKQEIEYYVDNYKPFDKAGAYGIQEWIGMVGIEKIEGSFYNVMGLPVQRLYEELIKF
jgi:septum formation protein